MNAQINEADFAKFVSALTRTFDDIAPLLPEIGEIIVSSVQTNFEVGGRHGTANEYGGSDAPGTWTRSQRAIDDNGQTLLDTGRLAASIVWAISGETLFIGTNVEYGAIHQFGGLTGKGHVVNIIPRPYLVLQNEDLRAIKDAVVEFYSRRIGALR
jgi:phage gpG-like protein